MRFDILGTLQVSTDDGAPIVVRESKVRTLLLQLLIADGAPVTVDRLIELLWPTKPPANPVASVHTKVWQLRRTLAGAEAGTQELVQSASSGYRLDRDAVDIDARLFEQMVRRARWDEPKERAQLLTEALALWRGPALADVADEPSAQPTVTRLEELRLTALEDHAETRLELGEHHLLVAELTDLLSQYPLRERLRAAQMRALYRSGQHAEALRSYDELRACLASDLGLDPGPELTALRQAMLEKDASLATPAAPTPRVRTNLPADVTSLIGRGPTIGHVRALLEAGRLVTLTGIGGVGKTRTALAAAAGLVTHYPDGVWLVEVSLLDADHEDSYDALVGLVADVLEVRDENPSGPLSPGQPLPLVARLAAALRSKQMLLVLDNCEHQVEHVAQLTQRLLRAAPGVRFLATSQESLGITGEQLWAVPPLDLPADEPDALIDTDDLPSAVQLFVTRATATAPGFTLDRTTAPAVHAICTRLDGIPLALELAATRVRALGVHEVADRLADRFALLSAGARGAPARQQTLRAAIDWSWDLLTDPERRILRRLAVHTGGFSLAAAEAVCTDTTADNGTGDVVHLLTRLVDRSLVAATTGPAGTRYSLAESIAAYCLEQLTPDEDAATRTRHINFHIHNAQHALTQLRSHEQRHVLEHLSADTANIRSALDFATRTGRASDALNLVNSMAWHWFLRGQLSEALNSLTQALSTAGADQYPAEQTTAMAWHAGLRLRSGDGVDALADCEDILRRSAEVHDRPARASTLWFLGFAQIGFGDQEASRHRIRQALIDFRDLGDRWGIAAALAALAVHAVLHSDLTEIENNGHESSQLFRELGDGWGQMQAMDTLAFLSEVRGDYDDAVRLHHEGLTIAEDLGLWSEVSIKLSGLGRIALLQGDYPRARALHERAFSMAVEQGFTFGEQFAEVGLGLGTRREGDLDAAEQHLRRWLDWCWEWQGHNGAALLLAELGFIAEQRGQPDLAETLHKEGYAAATTSADPRTVALTLEGLAGARAGAHHHDEAAALLGAAAAARSAAGAPLADGERGDVQRVSAIVRQDLGDHLFTEAYERGQHHNPSTLTVLVFDPDRIRQEQR